MQPSLDPSPPNGRIGRYEVLRKIATGGMAELFLAKQVGMEGFEKVVAIKRILSHLAYDEEFVAMFRDEARIVAKLNHPNIVQIYDLGKSGDSYFIAMEYIAGRNLSSIAKRARALGEQVPPTYIARCMAQACEGLFYAHTRRDIDGRDLQIIHRDVSPQNIIVSFSGAVKLVDFGIAKAASKAAHTRAGVLKGKYAYMSPEQIRGEPIDARSDLFSVGVVLYELLCGRRPFEKDNSIQTLKAIVQERHRPPRDLNPDIPERLERVIHRCLEKDRSARFGSAQEVQVALEDFVSSTAERCNNISISNWLGQLFEAELSRDNGSTIVFQGVGEVILPDASEPAEPSPLRSERPPLEAPSNSMLDLEGRSGLIEESPIERSFEPSPSDGYPDDSTEFAADLAAPAGFDEDATAFAMSPPTPAEIAAAKRLAAPAPAEPLPPEPTAEREDPWARSNTGESFAGLLLEQIEARPEGGSDEVGDATIAMPSLSGGSDVAAPLDPFASSSKAEVEDDPFGDRTIGMPPDDDGSDEEGDRTLGADEFRAMFSPAIEEEEVPFAPEASSDDEAMAFADATVAEPGLDDDDDDDLEDASVASVLAQLEEESTVRGLDDEPELPRAPQVLSSGYSDDRTLAGVTSDYEVSGLGLPPTGAYDPLPEAQREASGSTLGSPKARRGGAGIGAIALARVEVPLSSEPEIGEDPDGLLIDPDLDLDGLSDVGLEHPTTPVSVPRAQAEEHRAEYSALVGGREQDPVPSMLGSSNVPAASLSLSQVLAAPSPRPSAASPSRLQPIPRSPLAPPRAARSTSLIGRQIREVVRGDSVAPSALRAPDFERAPISPASIEIPPPAPVVGPPPPTAHRGWFGPVLQGAGIGGSVLGLAALTYFVLIPVLFPDREPKLIIKTEPDGAIVRVNGAEQRDRTPITIIGLNPSTTYRVSLEREGYQPVQQEVQVPPDRPIRMQIRLQPAAESELEVR